MRYEKRGSVARWENGTLIRVTEAGLAVEEGERFSCRPLVTEPLPPVDPARVLAVAREVVTLVRPPLRLERLVVSEGVAEHRVGATVWTERHERVHLSIARGTERALIRLGSFDTGDVATVADRFARCDAGERPAPARLRLAAPVSAAVLPLLAGLAPPNVALWQTGGGFDGRGLLIEEARIGNQPWPNWFRPSYRVRPVRLPLNLRLECPVDAIDPSRPIAVALLAEPAGLTLRLLISDGTASWPSTVRLTRIDAVAQERTWYPYSGGAFGAEMML